MWDKDNATSDDMICQGVLALGKVEKGGNFTEWVDLNYKGKNAGKILLSIQFHPDGGK